jgi:hypothetical protein
MKRSCSFESAWFREIRGSGEMQNGERRSRGSRWCAHQRGRRTETTGNRRQAELGWPTRVLVWAALQRTSGAGKRCIGFGVACESSWRCRFSWGDGETANGRRWLGAPAGGSAQGRYRVAAEVPSRACGGARDPPFIGAQASACLPASARTPRLATVAALGSAAPGANGPDGPRVGLIVGPGG